MTEPQFEMRQLIEGLAQGQALATLDHIVIAVRLSPFPMILVDRQSRVIAASSCSGFTAGVSVFDETPADERENLEHFNAQLESSGFWDHWCDHLHHEAEINGQRQLAAVVTAILIRGAVYALVQKAWHQMRNLPQDLVYVGLGLSTRLPNGDYRLAEGYLTDIVLLPKGTNDNQQRQLVGQRLQGMASNFSRLMVQYKSGTPASAPAAAPSAPHWSNWPNYQRGAPSGR